MSFRLKPLAPLAVALPICLTCTGLLDRGAFARTDGPVPGAGRAADTPSPESAAPPSLRSLRGVPERAADPRDPGSNDLRLEAGKLRAGDITLSFAAARSGQAPGLLARYRLALERESRRTIDRDASLFWADSGDEDGNPVQRAQREARRIFEGANGRVLSQFAESLVEDAASLRAARDYVEGVRFDVMNGGGLRFQAGGNDRSAAARDEETGDTGDRVAASFGLIALSSPRLEVRTSLPGGIRSRLEVPLTTPGLRASFSRRLAANLRGTMSFGVEDSGADRWMTATLGARF